MATDRTTPKVENAHFWGGQTTPKVAADSLGVVRPTSNYRKNAALVIDSNASRNEKRHSRGSSTPVKDYRRAGFVCEPNFTKRKKPQNPDSKDASALMRLLMLSEYELGDGRSVRRFLVNREEDQLITALETQGDRGDGYPDKMPNTQADREVHCYVECCRYVTWKLFQRGEYGNRDVATAVLFE